MILNVRIFYCENIRIIEGGFFGKINASGGFMNCINSLDHLNVLYINYRRKNKQNVIANFTQLYAYLPVKEYHNHSYSLE